MPRSRRGKTTTNRMENGVGRLANLEILTLFAALGGCAIMQYL